MKAPNITKGPWKWCGSKGQPHLHIYLSGQGGEAGHASGGFTDNPANAVAVAAVPDLLEALANAHAMLAAIREKEGYPGILHNDCQDAEQAALYALQKAGYTL